MGIGIEVASGSPADRFDALRTYMLASTLPLEAHAPNAAELRISARAYPLGALVLHTVLASGLYGVRTPRLAHDDTAPLVVLSLVLCGSAQVATSGRTVVQRPGDMVAISSTRTETSSYLPGATKVAIMVPAGALRLPPRVLDAGLGIVLDRRAPTTAVLRSYLRTAAQAAPGMSPADRAGLGPPTEDLIRLALAHQAGAEDRVRGSRARTLGLQILEHVHRNATDRSLDAAAVAASLNISERYVYRLLATMGTTLGDVLRRERLATARRLLQPSPVGNGTISAIAYRSGFADHSHFSREFRREYGMTPREWRASSGG